MLHRNGLDWVTYLGCYLDNFFAPDMSTSFDDKALHIEICVQRCYDTSRKYAALRYMEIAKVWRCFCDYTYGSYGKAVESDCNLQCPGNITQICGAVLRLSVYEIIRYTTTRTTTTTTRLTTTRTTTTKTSSINGTIEVNQNNQTEAYQENENVVVDDESKTTREEISSTTTTIGLQKIELSECPKKAYVNKPFSLQLDYLNIIPPIYIDIPTSSLQTIMEESPINITGVITAVGSYLVSAYDSSFLNQVLCPVIVIDSASNLVEMYNNSNLDDILPSYNLPETKIDINNVELMIDFMKRNIDISPCLTNCSNSGSCVSGSDNIPKCKCFDDFVGPSCQSSVRPCSNSQCMNGGKCIELSVNSTYDFECNCTKSYYGLKCENKIDFCWNKTCSGHGMCFYNQSSENAKCDCFQSYSGNDCEIESDEIKLIKKAIITTTIVAYIFMVLTFLSFILLDILEVFIEKQRRVDNYEKLKHK